MYNYSNMAIEVKIRKWGNSFGVILPKELLDRKGLKEEDGIVIEIVKEADLSKIFGSIKKRRLSGQKFKELVKEGWEK
ncbi:MAG: AbrB/MazE/SpoVT family DNA-binding domain-containing protein [Nanoarchaeota archaeon]